MNKQEAMQAVIQKVEECRVALNGVGGVSLENIPVSFDLKGVVAGTANRSTRSIRINLQLLVENFQDMIDDTVPHEVAHVYQRVLAPYSKPHGREWKMYMRALGIEATRCHSYSVANTVRRRTITRYVYGCPDCGKTVNMTPKQHERHMRAQENSGGGYYHCRIDAPYAFDRVLKLDNREVWKRAEEIAAGKR